MAQEINLGGTIYISSSRAAEKFGYSQDYIGQLLRAGRIIGKKIGGMWYVLEESLLGHRSQADAFVPTPPLKSELQYATNVPDSLLSFDGTPYVSAAEGSRITGYSQDYVGQLAREGAILSRQVGKRWYVDAKALKSHKAEKDYLLSKVQAASVGLREINSAPDALLEEFELHYKYETDNRVLLPNLRALSAAADESEDANKIPIRVIHAMNRVSRLPAHTVSDSDAEAPVRAPRISIFYGSFTAIVATIVVVVAYNVNLVQMIPTYGSSQSAVVRSTALADAAESGVRIATNTIRDIFFSNEIRYQRTENWTN